MTTVKFMLNRARQLNDGTYPLVAQLLRQRRKRVIYSSIHLYEDELDTVNARIIKTAANHRSTVQLRRMNAALSEFRKKISDTILKLENESRCYQTDDIVERYRITGRDELLHVHFHHQIDKLEKQNRIGMIAAFRSTLHSIQRFRGNHIKFSEIDSHFVHAYEQYLHSKKLSPNTVCYYIRNFKLLYNMAVKEGAPRASHENPFAGTRSSPYKTVKRALSREVLRKLAKMTTGNDTRPNLACDMFMFSFYTRGMAFVDIAFLKKSDIIDGVINYKRRKTGQHIQITVTESIHEIINRYQSASQYIFNLISSETPGKSYAEYRQALRAVNRELKVIAGELNLTVPLTSYMARHSWATQAKEHGAPISVISEGLGHTSEKITQIYLKEFDRSVLDSINEKVSKLE